MPLPAGIDSPTSPSALTWHVYQLFLLQLLLKRHTHLLLPGAMQCRRACVGVVHVYPPLRKHGLVQAPSGH